MLAAADFKRHVGDVEAALARKTDELHQYRHKLEAELSGKYPTCVHSHVHSHCILCALMGWSKSGLAYTVLSVAVVWHQRSVF